MANFQLRDVDDQLWARVSTRAQLAGWPLKALMVQLLDDYQAGRIQPSRPAPAPPPKMVDDLVVAMRFTCPKCNKSMEVECQYREHLGPLTFYAVECPHCHQITERALPGDILDIRP